MPRSSMAPTHCIVLSSEFLRVFGSARVALFVFRSRVVSGVDTPRSRAADAILRAAVGRRVARHSAAARAGCARHISATLDAAACGAAVRPRSDLSHGRWPETIFLAFLKSIIIMLTRVEVPLPRLPMHSSTPSLSRLDGDRESEQQRWAAFEQLLVEQALEAQIVTGQRAVVAGRRVMRIE
jgi:hypothetical protein